MSDDCSTDRPGGSRCASTNPLPISPQTRSWHAQACAHRDVRCYDEALGQVEAALWMGDSGLLVVTSAQCPAGRFDHPRDKEQT